MGRRGRRQVLQLDDVSSSHQSRQHGFKPQQGEEQRNQPASNPLLSLVGHYNSDSEEDGENDANSVLSTGRKEEHLAVPSKTDTDGGSSLKENLQPDRNLDSAVASFLAEIESISTEPKPTTAQGPQDTGRHSLHSHNSKADIGFIIKTDASSTVEDTRKKVKSAPSNAYKSMFIKGESEFVHSNEKKRRDGEKEEDEELPEEPVSVWQMVQDETTQYYYYWNTSTNEVTWEIPPDYTQFLLQYKEYEERLAKIPQHRLQALQGKAQRKKQSGGEKDCLTVAASNSFTEDCSVGDSKSNHGSSKSNKHSVGDCKSNHGSSKSHTHTEHKHSKMGHTDRKPLSPALSSGEVNRESVEYGPLLPPVESRDVDSNVAENGVKPDSRNDITTELKPDLSGSAGSVKDAMTPDFSTSHMDMFVVTESLPDPDSVDSESISADADAIISEVLEGSSGEDVLVTESTSKLEDSDVCHTSIKGPSNRALKNTEDGDDDDDDLDMDFDDIDDLDRALEKALEKKLEKKKSELSESQVSLAMETTLQPLSPRPAMAAAVTMAPVEKSADDDQCPQTSMATPALQYTQALGKATSNEQHGHTTMAVLMLDHKEASEHPVSRPHSLAPLQWQADHACVTSSVSDHLNDEKEGDVAQRLKRSSGEVTHSEPVEKKARLVAYDAAESEEEDGVDVRSGTCSTPSQDQAAKILPDAGYNNVLPIPSSERTDSLAELESMAEMALDKLGFLEVTAKGLSPLQTTLIQLQTRLKDWQEGGLNAEYFFQRMSEVNGLLEQYESAAVPPGWACHWDRNFRRYFYTHKVTGESQWDYPSDKDGSTTLPDTSQSVSMKGLKKSLGCEGKMAAEESSKDSSVPVSIRVESLHTDAVLRTDMIQQRVPGGSDGASVKPLTEQEESMQSAYQALFPGEPLPPGTELLFGLPPPPPPPFPPPDTSTGKDGYICGGDNEDSSNENEEEGEGEQWVHGVEGNEKMVVEDMDVSHSHDAWTAGDASQGGDVYTGGDVSQGGDVYADGDASQGGDVYTSGDVSQGGDMYAEGDVSQGGDALTGGAVGSEEHAGDSGVIARPPKLRFTATPAPSMLVEAVTGGSHQVSEDEPSALVVAAVPPTSNTLPYQQLEVSSSMSSAFSDANGPHTSCGPNIPKPSSTAASSSGLPQVEDGSPRTGSPAPAAESTAAGNHKHEKHKKKKKEKLGSTGLSLKKKGVSSLVQKWQKVKREVEQEERANEQRQMAIRQQLEEWKKENS